MHEVARASKDALTIRPMDISGMAQGRLRESNGVGEDEAPSPNVARVSVHGALATL